MNEIRFAVSGDLAAIRTIWSAVFTEDTVRDRDRFLQTVHLREECMVACADGKPVSMAFFLPAVLHTDGDAYSTRYLYAASTLPAYRGRGIFGELLHTALSVFKERGVAACFLNPAQPSLIGYYRRFGFEPAFFCRTLSGIAQTAQLPFTPLSGAEYLSLRKTLLPRDHVEWNDRFLRYAVSYATPLRIGEKACVLFSRNEDVLRVIELLGVPSDQQTAVCSALASHQGCKRFEARVFSEIGECFGMLLPLSADTIPLNTAPYMGLAFD